MISFVRSFVFGVALALSALALVAFAVGEPVVGVVLVVIVFALPIRRKAKR